MRNSYFAPKFLVTLFSFSMILNAQVNWTPITVGSAPASTRPVICNDPLGYLHIAWTSDDIYGGLVQYATNQYGGWGYQKQVAGSSGKQAYNPSITADRHGHTYIVYRYEVSEIRYASNYQLTSSYWQNMRSMSGGHFHESSIEVDRNFGSHVFAQDDTWGSNVFYQNLDLADVVIEGGTSPFFATAIDSQNILHFLGSHADGIWYTNNSSGTWSTAVTIDQIAESAYHPSITVDYNDHLHVVFMSNNGLYYLNNTSGSWSVPELIPSTAGIFPNIVVDENGKAHIVYYTQVEYGILYYTNNINGSWLESSYITTINEDNSPATEDVAHVESKIALNPKSNTVNIVYIDDDGTTVKIAQTRDFNLRRPVNTDTTTMLTTNHSVDAPDTLSTSASGVIDLLGFTISDAGGDGLPTKIKLMIIQGGTGMSTDISFNEVFSQVSLKSSDGTDINGSIYSMKIFFGNPDAVWKIIPEGQSIDFTLSGTLREPLQNVDNKSIEVKINGLYDVIIDTTGSRFAYSNSDVSSNPIFFQLIPDHFEFVNIGNDFYDQNLVEDFLAQIKIVDTNGNVATSVSDKLISLSAVQLDGVTPAPHALQSTEGLTKTMTNGIVMWTNLSYPDTGRIRILASMDILSGASDTLIVMPYYKHLVIGPNKECSNRLKQLGIENDFYHENNYQFPPTEQLPNYKSIVMATSNRFVWYTDSTKLKSFLNSGSDTSWKNVLAIGEYALGNNMNTPFSNHYFGGKVPWNFNHSKTKFKGVSGDPITDNLTLNVNRGSTGKLVLNKNLSGSSPILNHTKSGNTVGIKNDAMGYRTVWISPNFSEFSNVTQRDTLLNRIFRWFDEDLSTQQQPPVVTDIPNPDPIMEGNSFAPISLDDYVSDADNTDNEMTWTYSGNNELSVTINDTSHIATIGIPYADWNGSETITFTATDPGDSSDSDPATFTVTAVNDAPDSVIVIKPATGTFIEITQNNLDSILVFSWQPSFDVEGDKLLYSIKGKEGLEFLSQDSIESTTVKWSYNDIAVAIESVDTVSGFWTVFVTDSIDTAGAIDGDFSLSIDASALSLEDDIPLPDKFALYQNYPNPFNPMTTLRYDLPEQAHVILTIYDILGREVRTLVNHSEELGYKSVIWDGNNNLGQTVSAGVYIYRIKAGEFIQTKKMLLLK